MSFQRIRGHDGVLKHFELAVRKGRLAHAYLFTGPPGVGKRLFARELARALLCEQSSPAEGRFDACDRCPSCRLVEAQTHPDCFEVRRPEDKHEFPIDLMRELRQNFGMKPARGRGKVAIIDDADDLNEESANCFLKTLEEPPPRSVLILIGTSADRQLPTIVSRCQVIRFAPLPPALLQELLGVPVPAARLRGRLVRLSGGSPGQALDLADPALWDFRRRFVAALSRPQPDTVELAREWTRFVEEAGKDSAGQRRRAALVLRLLIDFFRQALCLSQSSRPADSDPDELPLQQSLADRLGPDLLLEILERCLQADQQLDRRVQLVLVLEALVDALGQMQPTPA
jgi:DNA polymerase-3 subunit delta'